MIDSMIEGGLKRKEIAAEIGCSSRTVSRIRSNRRLYGATKAPPNRVGRKKISPLAQQALVGLIDRDSDGSHSEMITFLCEEFQIDVSLSTLARCLKSEEITLKASARISDKQNPLLRDLHLHKRSDCQSFQMVCIDEAACNKQTTCRRRGRAKKGRRPTRKGDPSRGPNFQILAALTQEGVELARVYQGSTNGTVFEDFLEQLLEHCGKWPEPKSVLIMDNAPIHKSTKILQICANAKVRLLFLSPYYTDLNPIEEHFSEVKAFMRKERRYHEDLVQNDLQTFIFLAVDTVGAWKPSAEGHCRHADIAIEYPPDTGGSNRGVP